MPTEENNLRIDYIEFPADEVGRAQEFYTRVFGWKFQSYGDQYSSFEDGRIAGGFRGGEEAGSGGPLVVIYAVDLESTVGPIEVAGGKIVKPIFEFPGGRRFHFRDPCGNELAVWSDK